MNPIWKFRDSVARAPILRGRRTRPAEASVAARSSAAWKIVSGMVEGDATGLGEHETPAATFEEVMAEGRLERPDLGRESRLREVERHARRRVSVPSRATARNSRRWCRFSRPIQTDFQKTERFWRVICNFTKSGNWLVPPEQPNRPDFLHDFIPPAQTLSPRFSSFAVACAAFARARNAVPSLSPSCPKPPRLPLSASPSQVSCNSPWLALQR